RDAIYGIAGGQSPQSLINEVAARIHAGKSEVALVAGSEVIGAIKTASKLGLALDLGLNVDGDLDDRGMGPVLLTRGEVKHGLVKPAYFYALFENAIAARNGETRSEHRRAMAKLFAPFAAISAVNPYAQFGTAFSEDFLATPSPDNYEFADPFLKWHMAQDAVNLAAAVVVMSSARADEFGIAEDKRVYVHGAGEAVDDHISERPKLDGSWAMQVALGRALDQASKTAAEIDFLDFYSCFPCAVFSACDVLGINPATDPRPLTQTGGLPFFGGPGNNYSLHAVATMVETLRTNPGKFGLVLANGGWMTKEAAIVYSTMPPKSYSPAAEPATPETTLQPILGPCQGILETYTVIHGRDGPKQAIALGRTSNGDRFVASSKDRGLIDRLREETSFVDAPITTETEGECNTFMLA
ncbi:MAG: acetyl-CoA acetyltransferase, partial [Pseudomonadota bacterium]